MLKQSDAFNQAFASGERTLAAKVSVGNRDFTAEDLVSIEYDSAAMTGEQIGIGSTYENSVKISFANLIENIKAQDKVTAAIGIKLPNGTFEFAPLGVFYVDGEITMDRNNNLTSITAVDAMSWLEGIYKPKVVVPTTLSAMALDIANQAGVAIDQDNFGKLPNIAISSLPQNQTYRTVIGWLSALLPGYVTFTRNGQLALRGLNNDAYTVNTTNYEFQGLTKNENPYTVSGITVSKVTETSDYSATVTNDGTTGTDDVITSGDNTDIALQIGSTTGSQLILQNNFITDRILKDIWGKLEEIQYFPYTLNWFGNPAVEAGDWLTVFDAKGNQFVVPNNSYTLMFEGGLSATSSTGETITSPTDWNYHSPLSQIIKSIDKRLNATGTYTYYTPTQPPKPREGDLWYKTAGDSTELYIYSNLKWILVVSDVTGKQIGDKVDAAQIDIENARKVADAANALAGTKVGIADYNTKITQLSNDINFRVTQGDVINQINLEAGQTLIQSGKILLDSPSVIFSGSAFIPDAAIKNLSASKLTAGTVDANIINVINMNASHINAGILSGKNLSLNLESGEVEFQSGTIKNSTGKFEINIDAGEVTSIGESGNKAVFTNGGINYFNNSTDTKIAGQLGLNWHTLNTDIPNLVFQSIGKIVLAVTDPIVTEGTLSYDTVSSIAIDTNSVVTTSGYKYTGGPYGPYHPSISLGANGLDVKTYPSKYEPEKSDYSSINLRAFGDDGSTVAAGISIYAKPIFGDQIDITGNTGISGTLTTSAATISGDVVIWGKLSVVGAKNAVNVTRDGVRATPAYETAESYLGDIGEDATDDTGKSIVPIEVLFGDTVNTTIPYQVFLQSYNNAHVWVSSRDEAFFTVKSDQPNTAFTWEVKAKRRGYETDRLVKSNINTKDIAKMEDYQDE